MNAGSAPGSATSPNRANSANRGFAEIDGFPWGLPYGMRLKSMILGGPAPPPGLDSGGVTPGVAGGPK